MDEEPAPLRVDTWLWTARLAKTRALAVDAIKAGHVHLNGARVKPSKDVHVGDRLELVKGQVRLEVIVRGSVKRRVGAAQAALLYEETPASVAARAQLAAEREAGAREGARVGRRPTKRDRRRIDALRPFDVDPDEPA